MKAINVTKLLAISSILSLSLLQVAFAHPGRTAADGCHYCRTNCDRWGVAWNERHCHNNHSDDERSDLITAAHNPATHTHEIDFINIKSGDHAITEE